MFSAYYPKVTNEEQNTVVCRAEETIFNPINPPATTRWIE